MEGVNAQIKNTNIKTLGIATGAAFLTSIVFSALGSLGSNTTYENGILT